MSGEPVRGTRLRARRPVVHRVGLELLDQIARAWLNGAWARELAHYGDAFLATGTGALELRARMLYAVGRARWRLGDHDLAHAHFEDCLTIATQHEGLSSKRGWLGFGFGFEGLWSGDVDHAAADLAQAVALIDPVEAPAMNVEAGLWLACTKMQNDEDLPGARMLIERSLDPAANRWTPRTGGSPTGYSATSRFASHGSRKPRRRSSHR